ncbi:MAG: type II toxin-antitoxin system RelE/ParE family toxin [Pseudomonadota bacterium]
MGKIFYRSAARHDLIAHYIYLAENANDVTADRFLKNAEESFNALVLQPKMGALLALRHPVLQGLRKWHVNEFNKFLIFYLPRRKGVSIVRVLHAAQNWWTLLDIER